MNYDDFIGEVQNRIDVGDTGHTVEATRVVLTTLGERLQEGEATDLAAPLPMEVDRYLLEADSGQSFEWDEFVERVAERSGVDEADAQFRAQAVADLVWDVVPEGEVEDVRGSLPDDFEPLFEYVEQPQAPWQ